MRLHRLTMTAFGPFGGTHEVDFDTLSAAGLFLLHGATGAGKTSVLDAVCFALYGGVPGARQQPGGTLRSHHAEPHTLTEVVLDLTVGERRLEITRRPEQERPKLRGSGTTREKAQSWLREYDTGTGDWKALSRSHQEIGEEITQLTGMSRDQFCQVVLLPQGDFARFLRAGAEERAKLLGRLFDTGRFAAVEDHLAKMRRSAQEEVRAGDEALLGLAHRMRQAAGEAAPSAGAFADTDADAEAPGGGTPRAVPDQRRQAAAPAPARGRRPATTGPGTRTGAGQDDAAPLSPGDPGLADAVLEWAALARTEARERRDIAALAARAAEDAHTRATRRQDDVRELARRQRRHAEARRRAAELEATAPRRDAERERLERARAAESVAPAVALRESAEAEHRRAAAEESRSRAPLPQDIADAAPARLAELEGEAREELGSLSAARRAEAREGAIAAELGALERESRADEEALREAEEWLAGWERTREEHQRRVDAAQEALARTEHLAGQLEPARRRLEAARRRDRLAGETEAARETSLRAREAASAARERWLDLKDRRLRGFAAELAAGLRDGEPCAVCGSPEHPEPARLDAEHVGQEAEDGAFAASGRAESARESAEETFGRLREELAAARAESGEEETGELAEVAARLEREHAEAHGLAAGAHAAKEALARAEGEYERRRAQQQDAARRGAARTSQREALQREQASLAEELRQARGEARSVAERAASLERRVALLTGAAEAARTAQGTAQRLKEADARLADAAYRAHFDTPGAAAEAVLGEAEQAALRERLEARQAEEAAVAAELADPELAEAAGEAPADTEEAERAVREATARLRAASAADEAARHRCDELDRLTARALAEARRVAPLRESYERVARLAGLAAGTSAENERKMRLESYVLAARLEQVAAAASARLSHMSGGRYTLVHSDARASGRGRSGLGLHVIDAWTGVERDTATLSGGETFSASLALALGLADVVTEEAGGTRLETLFIDEGFGSLDEQTLDEVLDVLDSLRERDRCVGIVSHVADLRQRVPVQLEVAKSRKGSSLRLRSAPVRA
ncbi:AAA family ATPase [Streptomyces daliensis]|uniref:Nuclease SbcCD subunit C n=1 Tax=Streptomyces daliensis TaxID=299421 RepID=A0A8T4ISS2_9ACTN|nr:SMC family ATPase [Streptomyces daliensis]